MTYLKLMTFDLKGRAGLVAGTAVLALCTLGGCKKPVDDATITTNVKAALGADATTAQSAIDVSTQNGAVTLTGNVTDDQISAAAAADASKVAGVKVVVNSVKIAGIPVAPTVTTVASPTQVSRPRPATPQERRAIVEHQPMPGYGDNDNRNNQAPPPPPPPPPSNDRLVTLQAGATLPIRIDQSLSSETAQPGQTFSGVVTHEVIADGLVAIPAGSAVTGRVVDAKDATHFKGSSLLSIEVTSVRRHGQTLSVATDAYTVEGKGRGVNSAEKIGGGAAVGAILGGIFGGGKGAAIGAAAGGGGGAVVQGVTRGQQVAIPSETLVRFHLAQPITVRTDEQPSGDENVTLRERQ